MHRITCTFRTTFTVAIAVAVFLLTANARGQGTSGSFPGPIDSQQLARYGARLDLSDSQRLAVEAVHDDYLLQFRLLRDSEIAAFLQEQQGVQGGIPERKVVEVLLEKLDRIQAKIAAIDNRMFDDMIPILSPEQQADVPSLRLARERKRYGPLQTAATYGRQSADFSDLVVGLELTPDEALTVETIISGYERRMTSTMRKQHKAITGMQLDMMDMLAERGYSDISQETLMKDPALLQEVIKQIQEVYGDLRANVSELADELRELNKKTYTRLAAAVPEPQARRLRNGYCRVSYPRLAALVGHSESDWMARALLLDELTAEQREALAASSEAYQRRISELLARGVDVIDAFWAGFSPFEVNQERNEQFGRDLRDLQQQGDAAQADPFAMLVERLDDDTVDDLRRAASTIDAGTRTRTAATGDDDDRDTDVTEQFEFAADRFLPPRISGRDIERYLKQLQLEDDMRSVLDVIHRKYLQDLSELEVFNELRDARQAARDNAGAAEAEGEDEGESAVARIDRVYAMRRRAIDAMAAADTAFFDDLRAILGDEGTHLADRVERSRLRQAYTGSASELLALGRDNSAEASVDVISIVLAEQPSGETLTELDEIFAVYERDAATAFRARLDAQLTMQQMTDRWMLEIQEAAAEDLAAVIDLQTRYREAMKVPAGHVAATDQAVVDLNRRTLEQVLAAVSRDDADAMRRAYDLTSYPSIYNDPGSLDKPLARALELGDLTSEGRAQLMDVAATYRTEYEVISRKMIDHLGSSAVNVVGLDPDSFREWQRRQQQLAKYRFDRNELNGRATSRMQAILNEEQLRRIGGLPEPAGEDDFFFYR